METVVCSVDIDANLLKESAQDLSIVFDIVAGEKERMIKLISYVFNHLKEYVSAYYEIEWVTDLTGEIECGPNYAEIKEIKI